MVVKGLPQLLPSAMACEEMADIFGVVGWLRHVAASPPTPRNLSRGTSPQPQALPLGAHPPD